jgi:predicted RNA-binding protein with PIN domain
MTILIDAFNILKQIGRSAHISEKDRLAFIKQMAYYGKLKGHTVIVVFDDGFYDRCVVTKKEGITIVYAGHYQTADDYIKNYVQEHNNNQTLVVSSDRNLYTFAARQGAYTLGSLEFYKLVQERLAQQPIKIVKSKNAPQKMHPASDNPELDQLMEEASLITIHKDSLETKIQEKKKGNPERLSKSEKKLVKIIKKL